MPTTLLDPSTLADDETRAGELDGIVAAVTRREFIVGTAALAGLMACGSDDDSGEAGSPAPSDRVVETTNGPVTVPARPRRVVAINDYPMATMFDLDFDPIGVYSAGEQYVSHQYLDRWRDIPKVSDGQVAGAVNVERVAELRPDLILGLDAQDAPYDQLSAIAPTVLLTFEGMTWRDLAAQTADVLGRSSDLDALVDRYRDRAEEIRTQHAQVLSSTPIAVLQGGFDQGQFWLYGPTSNAGEVLADADVRFASASASADNGNQQTVSYEQIDILDDADAILYYTTSDGSPANLGPDLFAQPAFQRLPAATANRLYGTPYLLPASYSDAIGLLDDLAAALQDLTDN